MIHAIKKIVALFTKKERRQLKRIACNIKAHFFIEIHEKSHRGGTTITDMTEEGLCCNEMSFFHEDREVSLKLKTNLLIYFSLHQKDGSTHNFEAVGKIRSIKRDSLGRICKVGIKIVSMKEGEKKIFCDCISLLTEKEPQQQ